MHAVHFRYAKFAIVHAKYASLPGPVFQNYARTIISTP